MTHGNLSMPPTPLAFAKGSKGISKVGDEVITLYQGYVKQYQKEYDKEANKLGSEQDTITLREY